MGNIVAGADGDAKVHEVDRFLTIGDSTEVKTPIHEFSRDIMFKTLVIMSGEDDLGKSDAALSKVNGNAGQAIACC